MVALPGQGDFVVRVPEGELGVEPGGLFIGEVFGADLQGPADAVERIALAAAVPEGVLLDPAADLIDLGQGPVLPQPQRRQTQSQRLRGDIFIPAASLKDRPAILPFASLVTATCTESSTGSIENRIAWPSPTAAAAIESSRSA